MFAGDVSYQEPASVAEDTKDEGRAHSFCDKSC